MTKEKFYITTSIAYTNAPPHIGYALELVQADVMARHQRLLGKDVFFLTGTDEHGEKIVKAAEKAGKGLEEFTDDISSKFKDLAKILNISNDDFIRTTDEKRHWPTVQKTWKKLADKGDIYKKKYKGLYCVGCESFVKEKDLVSGLCPNHQQAPEVVEEENYFFKLSKYSDKVREAIKKDKIKIIPSGRKNEILSFIEQGIEDTSCSRSSEKLKWGIPVSGDDGQITYIWFEALLNYLSALESSGKEDFWPADVHCIGKDIFRFHVLLWPAMLLALGKKLPKNIFVHGYITSRGQKISKSLGNVVDPFELVEKYGVDPLRYFLLRELPSTEDGDFTLERLKERYNSDLANGVGNTVNRVLTMVDKYADGIIPEYKGIMLKEGKDLNLIRDSVFPRIFKDWQWHLEHFYFNLCLKDIMEGFKEIDREIGIEKPWDSSKKFASHKFYSWSEAIRILSVRLLPFIPNTAEEIIRKLGLDPEKEKNKNFGKAVEWDNSKPETKIKKGEILFPRLD